MDLVPYCPGDVIDAATLRERGLTSHDVEALCGAGRLHRLARGWFATREPTGEVDRHLPTLRALLHHFEGRAAASHHSRLLASGIPVWRADLSVVHLTRTADRGAGSRAGYRLHPLLGGLTVSDTGRGPAVPLTAAVVQTGIVNGPMDALIAADAALHLGLADRSALDDALRLFEGRTGIAPVRAALAHADGRHESPGETRLAGVLRDLGIAATPQVRVDTRLGPKRVDFRLHDHPVVLEFDGAVKYRPRADLGTDPLFEEKLREDAIRDEQHEVVRVVWRHLSDPGGIHRRVDDAVARTRRRAA